MYNVHCTWPKISTGLGKAQASSSPSPFFAFFSRQCCRLFSENGWTWWSNTFEQRKRWWGNPIYNDLSSRPTTASCSAAQSFDTFIRWHFPQMPIFLLWSLFVIPFNHNSNNLRKTLHTWIGRCTITYNTNALDSKLDLKALRCKYTLPEPC